MLLNNQLRQISHRIQFHQRIAFQLASALRIPPPPTSPHSHAYTMSSTSSSSSASWSRPSDWPQPSSLERVLLGIGNPLLDISATVPQSFFDKYDIKPANAILAEEKHLPMYDDLVKNYNVDYTAGGATQNAIRIAQYFLQQSNCTSYIGCIGDDEFGAQMRKNATTDGVNVQYLVDPDTPSGTCAVAIINKDRSLVANLGAANKYKLEHLQEKEQQQTIEKASYFYSAGFFLTVSPPSLMHIAEHVNKNNKVLAINLAAPFICQFFKQPLLAALEYTDFVFGNESEAEAFGEANELDDKSPKGVVKYLSQYKSQRQGRKRVAVITQGKERTLLAVDGIVQEYEVPQLDQEKIIDANGAGDAFVGGFLSQLIKGQSLDRCVAAGHYASRHILQVSGIVLQGFPKQLDF